MGTGWTCVVIDDHGNVQLEQLDDGGEDWYAAGPSGEHLGRLAEALEAALGGPPEGEWLATLVTTIQQDRQSQGRSMLLVKRARGTWFHATFSANRESIQRHGLDRTRMTGSGIAGSVAPEADGIFLCADLESAEWFARMGRGRNHPVDIWAVKLDGTWLIGDPGASGGGDDAWMICPQPIPSTALQLVRANWTEG